MEKKYFLLSSRYNKTKPSEFGMIRQSDDNIYLFSEDNSMWKQMDLYDFGWGKEIGFCRMPMLGFEQLFDLLVNSQDEDNRHGAAAILLDLYADSLLEKCLDIIRTNSNLAKYKYAFKILKLDNPVNRSSTCGKTVEDIESDYCKWKYISKKVKEVS